MVQQRLQAVEGGGGGIYQWNIFQINCCAMLVARRCVYVWGAIVDVIFLLFLSLVIIALPWAFLFFRVFYGYVNYPPVSATLPG